MKLYGQRGLDAALLLALGALLLAPGAGAGAQALQALYTAAQAEAGEAVYATSCASCHLTNFQGSGEAPALAGPDFLNLWGPEPVGGLIELVALTMPPTSPGSLTGGEYAAVVAYLLRANGIPASGTPSARRPTDRYWRRWRPPAPRRAAPRNRDAPATSPRRTPSTARPPSWESASRPRPGSPRSSGRSRGSGRPPPPT